MNRLWLVGDFVALRTEVLHFNNQAELVLLFAGFTALYKVLYWKQWMPFILNSQLINVLKVM